jgi:hypothetical protein
MSNRDPKSKNLLGHIPKKMTDTEKMIEIGKMTEIDPNPLNQKPTNHRKFVFWVQKR